MKKLVLVIIPLYKPKLSPLEEIAVIQCFKVLGEFEIVAVKPERLNLENYKMEFDKVISLDNEFFDNIIGYNKLMLSSSFYKLFLDYKYMLIYQPDAFVFKNDLVYWCNQGYDYIGAPWLKYSKYPDLVKKYKNYLIRYIHTKLNKTLSGSYIPTEIQTENRVGNGGFSLRNIQKFHDICIQDSKMINLYNSREEYQFAEDVFWSIEVNRKTKRLKIPNYKIAVNFSIENNPMGAFVLTNNKIPFGCHAWDVNLNFWAQILNDHGITI